VFCKKITHGTILYSRIALAAERNLVLGYANAPQAAGQRLCGVVALLVTTAGCSGRRDSCDTSPGVSFHQRKPWVVHARVSAGRLRTSLRVRVSFGISARPSAAACLCGTKIGTARLDCIALASLSRRWVSSLACYTKRRGVRLYEVPVNRLSA